MADLPEVLAERLRALEARLGALEALVVDARNYKRNRNLALLGAVLGVAGGLAAVILAAIVH